jgi:hypothetical protein
MRIWQVFCFLLFFTVSAAAEQTLANFSWFQLAKEGKLKTGQIIMKDDKTSFDQLRVDNPNDKLTIITVLTLDKPPISNKLYALKGEVRHERVQGEAFLEMLTYFGDYEYYQSQTIAKKGPMKNIQGSSEWRDFLLPFLNQKNELPTKLVFNVYFPKKGTVYLGPIRLVQFSDDEDPFKNPE